MSATIRSYFYTRNSGLQNQSQLFVRKGLNGEARLLIDPNAWAKDGATALDGLGSRRRMVRKLLYRCRMADRTGASCGCSTSPPARWATRSAGPSSPACLGRQFEGFLYSRFPSRRRGRTSRRCNTNQAVWFHRIGTPQARTSWSTPRPTARAQPHRHGHARWALGDGHQSSIGTDARYEVHVDRPAAARAGLAGAAAGHRVRA
jgi:prolyl oligopeptidase